MAQRRERSAERGIAGPLRPGGVVDAESGHREKAAVPLQLANIDGNAVAAVETPHRSGLVFGRQFGDPVGAGAALPAEEAIGCVEAGALACNQIHHRVTLLSILAAATAGTEYVIFPNR